jgi:hypothetical protein
MLMLIEMLGTVLHEPVREIEIQPRRKKPQIGTAIESKP